MLINNEKSCVLIFKSARNKQNIIINIKINNKSIAQVNNFKYLGLELDCHMNWEPHYNKVLNKMSQRVYLINRNKNSLSCKWLQIITYGIILSVLDYCLPIWGNLKSINQLSKSIKYNKIESQS